MSAFRWRPIPICGVLMTVAGPLGGAPAGHSDQPEVVKVSILDGEVQGGGVIHDFACVTSSCNGVRILDGNGYGLKGCEFSDGGPGGSPKCTGNCFYCIGATPLAVCRSNPGNDCIIGGAGTVDCGKAWNSPCFYSTALGLQQPCSCATTGGTPSFTSCKMPNCQ